MEKSKTPSSCSKICLNPLFRRFEKYLSYKTQARHFSVRAGKCLCRKDQCICKSKGQDSHRVFSPETPGADRPGGDSYTRDRPVTISIYRYYYRCCEHIHNDHPAIGRAGQDKKTCVWDSERRFNECCAHCYGAFWDSCRSNESEYPIDLCSMCGLSHFGDSAFGYQRGIQALPVS